MSSFFERIEKSPTSIVLMPAIGLLGLMDATFLTMKHFQGITPGCSAVFGCGDVLTSQYSQILGIPTSLLGALYYLTIIVISLVYINKGDNKLLKYVSYLTIIGFIFSIFLVYIQLFVIGSICIYCMFSALTSTVLFILGMYNLKKLKSIKENG